MRYKMMHKLNKENVITKCVNCLMKLIQVYIFVISVFNLNIEAQDAKEDLLPKKHYSLMQLKKQIRGKASYSKNVQSSALLTLNDHNAFLSLPKEMLLHIVKELDPISLVSLKCSCRMLEGLIVDQVLYSSIPPELISRFPMRTSPVTIIFGELFYSKGIKIQDKTYIQKAAKLHHKKALEWLHNQPKKSKDGQQKMSAFDYLQVFAASLSQLAVFSPMIFPIMPYNHAFNPHH
ncbi:MAG: F-box protein [Silvanigrellaceae bacterium]|nr:F-box protein [Silvanigrellaceae bacterium]